MIGKVILTEVQEADMESQLTFLRKHCNQSIRIQESHPAIPEHAEAIAVRGNWTANNEVVFSAATLRAAVYAAFQALSVYVEMVERPVKALYVRGVRIGTLNEVQDNPQRIYDTLATIPDFVAMFAVLDDDDDEACSFMAEFGVYGEADKYAQSIGRMKNPRKISILKKGKR